MRLRPTFIILLVTALIGSAQVINAPPATVMFANSGLFAVKVNREPWLRGLAGAATPGWKKEFLQTDANANRVLQRADGGFDFTGVLGPDASPTTALASYRQTLVPLGNILSLTWQFHITRAVELDLLYVSFSLPARRFAGKTIRMDHHDVTLPERPAPASQRPVTSRPQRIVIDSGSLGPVAIRFNRPQVVWIEDLRRSGGDDFELRILLATGELKTDDEFFLALQVELAETPEILVGGPGREYQNDTKSWLPFEIPLAAKRPAVSKPEQRPATDASELLQAPAGKFGVLQAKAGHFVWSNGARQKFWGIRLASGAIPDKAHAADVAERLAMLGVNLVRWPANALPPDDAGRDPFDYFFAELGRRGIYSHFDLTSASTVNTTDADRRAELAERAADAWLDRKNRYTGKRYADDPSLAVVQITGDDSAATYPAQATPLRRELEAGCCRRVCAHLRSIGVKCPVLASDPASTAGDAIGLSSFWDTPRPDGIFADRALVSSDGGYLRQFASAAVAHKPLLITGIGYGEHNEYRAEAPLLLAAHAALQDWDGVVWAGDAGDPAVIGQFPTAARIFLGGLVSPSRLNTHWLRSDSEKTPASPPEWLTFISRWRTALPGFIAPPPDIVIAPADDKAPSSPPAKTPVSPAQKPGNNPGVFQRLWAGTAGKFDKSPTATASTRLAQKPGDNSVVLQRLWVGAARKLGVPLSWEEGGGREFASDTGQLAWDQDHGQFTVLAPMCCAAVGFIGGKTVTLTDATVDTSAPRFAAISLTALDGQPVAKSRRLLLTATARCENTDQRWLEMIDGNVRVLSVKPGVRLEPVRSTITLRRPQTFKVFPLDASGQRLKELPVGLASEGFAFTINGESLYYEVVTEGGLRLWPFGK